MPRHDGRQSDQLRPLVLETGFSRHAEGSCLIKAGNTQVICTASLDSGVPPFLRGKGTGWVTAEYGMLPRSTDSRMPREAARGKQSGRTQEIQRLIGRSLRAVTNFSKMGERQIIVDCDVIQADGGTRTASITGGYVALALCFQKMLKDGLIETIPLTDHVAAVSCGILKGEAILDLNYEEDSTAEVDSNFVFTGDGRIVEIQGTAEEEPFTDDQFNAMMGLARRGIAELVNAQKKVLA